MEKFGNCRIKLTGSTQPDFQQDVASLQFTTKLSSNLHRWSSGKGSLQSKDTCYALQVAAIVLKFKYFKQYLFFPVQQLFQLNLCGNSAIRRNIPLLPSPFSPVKEYQLFHKMALYKDKCKAVRSCVIRLQDGALLLVVLKLSHNYWLKSCPCRQWQNFPGRVCGRQGFPSCHRLRRVNFSV